MKIQRPWKHDGINDWADTNLLTNTAYYQQLRKYVECGEIELAYNHAVRDDSEPTNFRTAELRRRVIKFMDRVRDEWYAKGNKAFSLVEPKDWLDIPRFEAVYKLIHAHVVDAALEEVTLLDIGCYTGYFLRNVHEKLTEVGCVVNVQGIDIQKHLMEFVQLRCGAVSNMHFTHHNAEQPFNDTRVTDYHVVTLLEALTHALDPYAVLVNAVDSLKSHGLLVATVSTPYLADSNNLSRIYPDQERLRSFTPELIIELFNRVREARGIDKLKISRIQSEYRNTELIVTVVRG